MRNDKVKFLTYSAVMTALIYVFTGLLHLPSFTGYVHIGDAFIYLSASLLPLRYAAACSAVGAGFADILSGYGAWAPGTIVIKILTACCFSAKGDKIVNKRNLLAILPAAAVCAGGYFLYNGLFIGSFAAAAVEIPGNVSQAAFSALVYVFLGSALDKADSKGRLAGFGKSIE